MKATESAAESARATAPEHPFETSASAPKTSASAPEMSPAPKMSPLRVAPGGRAFETFDGASWLPIGANDAIAWVGLEPLWRGRDLKEVEKYLRTYADQGATLLRLMLEYAHGDAHFLEDPVGHFRPEMLRIWDDLLEICERLNLRVLLTPYDTFWMARRWHRHPYNARNGGPAESPASFFTDEATIAATLGRFEFLIERYAGRAVIAMWDLWNEIHPHWGGSPGEQSAVIARQSAQIRACEMRVQGWTRPQTVSIFGPDPQDGYAELIFRHPDLDFASTHIYSQGAIDFPLNTVAPAAMMGKWTRFGLEQTPPNRPFFDTEHGPIHMFNDHKRRMRARFDDEYERHLMWAHLASGGAGSGMRWPARHPHVLTPGMKIALGGLANFAREVDWRVFEPRDCRAQIKLVGVSKREIELFAVGDARQVVAFLLRRAPSGHRGPLPKMDALEGVEVTFGGLSAGEVEILSFDPVGGETLNCQIAPVVRGKASVKAPPWEHEIAFAVRPAVTNPAVMNP